MLRPVRHLPGLLISVFLTLLYLRTLAPGLTWGFDGADGGDLITAAATGGVPHPSGYPTYLVLASVFLRIPIGSLAFRTNLLSLAAAVLAAALIYALVLAASQSVFAASVASIFFGTAPLVWSQAIITEVYTLQALLTVCFLGLLLSGRRSRFNELAVGIVTGLSLGNHLMAAFLLPLLLLRPGSPGEAVATNSERATVGPASMAKVYLQRLVGLGAGLSIYLVIPLRAASHAPVNWGNAHNLSGLLSLVSGQVYWSRLGQSNAAYLVNGARSWAHFMVQQLGPAGLLLAIAGLIVLFRPRVLYFATIWMAISYSNLSIIYYSADSYVYVMPVLVSCSIWIGLGSHWLMERVSGALAYGGRAVVIVVMGFFLFQGILVVPRMDLSSDRRAEDFAHAILDSAPPRSILLTEGDEATFALWYFHYALRERPDMAVVSSDLFAQPWYREVLRYTYADLALPIEPWSPALAQANPGRTVCVVASILQPRLECTPQYGRLAWRTQGN